MARPCLRREGGRFLAWALVGVLHTLIHLGVVVGMVEGLGCGPLLANGAGFATASTSSFFANSRWAFRKAPTAGRYLRFMLVSGAGLATTLACSALASTLRWHYLVGVLLTLVLLPVLTYLSHRAWTWQGPQP